MTIEIRVPRLGWNMEEGVFIAWLKRDGDAIQPGDPLFTLEGDKAVQDIEATDAGTLRIDPNGPDDGDTIAVGTLLGYLVAAGETPPFTSVKVGEEKKAVALSPAVTMPVQAREEDARPQRTLPAISPRARRVARELGVDWTRLNGSGRTGRVRERDVRAAGHSTSPSGARPRPLSPTRRAIAARMLTSLRMTAPVTLTTTADATELVSLRTRLKAEAAAKPLPTYTDLIVKLAAHALQAHPALNARWEEDGIVVLQEIHIGIAVDTEAGLLAPVIRDVPSLGLSELAARSRDLVERARSRKLPAEAMEGGTFTVTNLGAFGIDAFTPIINHPECAILGVGRIRRVPAVVDEQIVPRDQVTLSLTFDHRLVDGAPAARFLDSLRKGIEDPAQWLTTAKAE